MIIDFSAHLISRAVNRILNQAHQGIASQRACRGSEKNTDAEFQLAHIEKFGIDMQILSFPSITQPVFLSLRDEEAARICSLSNDDNSALCKQYPKKFVNVPRR